MPGEIYRMIKIPYEQYNCFPIRMYHRILTIRMTMCCVVCLSHRIASHRIEEIGIPVVNVSSSSIRISIWACDPILSPKSCRVYQITRTHAHKKVWKTFAIWFRHCVYVRRWQIVRAIIKKILPPDRTSMWRRRQRRRPLLSNCIVLVSDMRFSYACIQFEVGLNTIIQREAFFVVVVSGTPHTDGVFNPKNLE